MEIEINAIDNVIANIVLYTAFQAAKGIERTHKLNENRKF